MINRNLAWLSILMIFSGTNLKHAHTAPAYENPLVKVISSYRDLSTGQIVSVEGVGSVIETGLPSPKFVVLTAGHVAAGNSVHVLGQHGKIFKTGTVRLDTTDLATIELTEKPDNLLPLARFNLETNILSATVKSPSLETSRYHRSRFVYQSESGVRLQASALSTALFVGTIPTLLILPPWLKASEKKRSRSELDRLIFASPTETGKMEPVALLPRFESGTSGSPIISQDPGGASYISGIITQSLRAMDSGGSYASLATGATAIGNLIFQLGNDIRRSESRHHWRIWRGAFVRVGEVIEVFLNSGPIGNGVVVDGRSSPYNMDSASKSAEESPTRDYTDAALARSIEQAFKNPRANGERFYNGQPTLGKPVTVR